MTAFCTACGHAGADEDRFCAACGVPRRTAATSDTAHDAAATAPPKATSKVSALVGVGLLAGMGLLPLFFFGGSCSGSTEGQVVVEGGPRPAFTFRPTGCASMQPYGRFGANLHGDGPNDGGFYVTKDPTRGATIEIEIPGSCRNVDGTECTVFDVPRASCRVFETHVEFTGVTVNDVRLVKGRASVDCTLDDGTTVRGRVAFDGC